MSSIEPTAITPTVERPVEAFVERPMERPTFDFDFTVGNSTNSQTQRIRSSKMVKTMIAPGARDAPKFSSKKPHELRRFLRMMEDLWNEAGIDDDDARKALIGKYADQESEEEWCALETYESGHTWEEFKEELMANYPEAAAAERGTPARIRQLCSETRKIRLGDLDALYAFRRAFMAEATKLLKPPAAMANRELVELFIGCLSEHLASSILQFLGHNMASQNDKGKARADDKGTGTLRRPEDKYDLKDVCKAAIHVSESSQGMFNLMKRESSANVEERGMFLFNQPVSEAKTLSQKVDELEGVQALERDRLVSINRTMESKMSGLEEMMKTLLAQSQGGTKSDACKGDCRGSGCKTHESHGGPPQRWGSGKTMDNEKCFWCGLLGHFQADCEDLKNQIRAGNVKVNPEGKLRLKDGSFIPHQPVGATLKEKVERHYARKPSQFFYGEYEEGDLVPSPMMPKYSQFLNTNDEAEKRVARLEAELELRKREDALELRKRRLELEEKKLEQSSGHSRAANVNALDLLGQLTEEEVAVIKGVRAGFP